MRRSGLTLLAPPQLRSRARRSSDETVLWRGIARQASNGKKAWPSYIHVHCKDEAGHLPDPSSAAGPPTRPPWQSG